MLLFVCLASVARSLFGALQPFGELLTLASSFARQCAMVLSLQIKILNSTFVLSKCFVASGCSVILNSSMPYLTSVIF